MEKKALNVITSSTIRGLVSKANELNITKEDIVTLMDSKGQYLLIYYK